MGSGVFRTIFREGGGVVFDISETLQTRFLELKKKDIELNFFK